MQLVCIGPGSINTYMPKDDILQYGDLGKANLVYIIIKINKCCVYI